MTDHDDAARSWAEWEREVIELTNALREALAIAGGSGADFTWEAEERLRELRDLADKAEREYPRLSPHPDKHGKED